VELEPFSTPEELMKALRSDTVRYPVLAEKMPWQ
jgi:hypothetical protein